MIVPIVIAIALTSQYSPGVMEGTVHIRQTMPTSHPLPMDLPPVSGFIAVEECNKIGEIWLLRKPGGPWEEFMVADCARQDDSDGTRTWMRERNILCEVDYPTAKRWGIVGRLAPVERGLEPPFGLYP